MERDNHMREGVADELAQGASGPVAGSVTGANVGGDIVGSLAGTLTGSAAASDLVDSEVPEEELAPIDLDALSAFGATASQHPTADGSEDSSANG